MNVRKIVLNTLINFEEKGGYSNLLLNSVLNSADLTHFDKRFATRLFYGVIERRLTLDFIIGKLSSKGTKKLSPLILNALRLGLFQIIYMDKIPDSAAVNETVKLIKASKEKYASGFVNAVLREYLRSAPALPSGESTETLEIKYSCPKWFIEELFQYLGRDEGEAFLSSALLEAPTYIRINSLKASPEKVREELFALEIETLNTPLEYALKIKGFSSIEALPQFKRGEIYVQDLASQIAVSALAPKKGERLLDICAAPGGKSFTSAQYMENCGEILSCDLYEHRVGLIKKTAERLGLGIIEARVNDAEKKSGSLSEFDKIICDVPCSGFGDIRRKPEIKYKSPLDLTNLPTLQYNILENSSKYLKAGGVLMYSTCTLRYCENEGVVEKFLQNHPSFEIIESNALGNVSGYHRIASTECDGFFFVLLKRR